MRSHDARFNFASRFPHEVLSEVVYIGRQRQTARDTEDSEDLLRLLLEARELMVAHQKLLEREMAEWRTLHPEY